MIVIPELKLKALKVNEVYRVNVAHRGSKGFKVKKVEMLTNLLVMQGSLALRLSIVIQSKYLLILMQVLG